MLVSGGGAKNPGAVRRHPRRSSSGRRASSASRVPRDRAVRATAISTARPRSPSRSRSSAGSPAGARGQRPERDGRARPAHSRLAHAGVTLAALLVPALRWDAGHGFSHLRRIDRRRARPRASAGSCSSAARKPRLRSSPPSCTRRSSIPLLLAADAERGAGQQFDGCVALPPLGALGFLDDRGRDAPRRPGHRARPQADRASTGRSRPCATSISRRATRSSGRAPRGTIRHASAR